MKTIVKAAGILIRDKKLLVERSVNKEFFIAPGGQVEAGETHLQALVRELQEEFSIVVAEQDCAEFGTFMAAAAGMPDTEVIMHVFTVNAWQGEPVPSSEVEEIRWITSHIPDDMKVGSIFEHDVIPRLKAQSLIE